MMRKKIAIASGGTGGHIYPAQALAEQLKKRDDQVEIFYLGGGLEDNRFFTSDHRFETVSAATFSSKKPWQMAKELGAIGRGIVESRRILKREKPDVIVGFGSYHTLPPLAAAKSMGIPIILHEGNSFPGKINRLMSRFATVTGVHFPAATGRLRGKTVEVGMPVRSGYDVAFCSQTEARRHFHLDSKLFTFLVFGGSQGALALNLLFSKAIVDHLSLRSSRYQVLHITGSDTVAKELQQLYDEHDVRASVLPFEKRMDLAWRSADMAVGRAGAATIAEQLAMETPGILIPYPYATDKHQDCNAHYLADDVGGAVVFQESQLGPKKLASAISDLVADDKKKLVLMREAMQRYKKQQRHRDLCSVVCEVAGIDVR